MWFSAYEVAKANCLDPKALIGFATKNDQRYGVELHAWGEIVIDALEVGVLLNDFRTQCPDSCNMPTDGASDPNCEWNPPDFFQLNWKGERVWSEGNPKWKEEPPVVKRRLP